MNIFESLDSVRPFTCGFDASALGPIEELRRSLVATPERCRNCPALTMLGEIAVEYVVTYANINHLAMHDLDASEAEQLEYSSHIKALISLLKTEGLFVNASTTDISIEDIAKYIRQQNGDTLELAHHEAMEAVARFNEIKDSCNNGSFKMRAVKDGKQYTATICSSDAATNLFCDESGTANELARFEVKRLD